MNRITITKDTTMHRLTCILALALSLAAARSSFAATIGASGGGGPSTTTSYDGSRIDGFAIVEDVAYDSGAGPWQKELVNIGTGAGNMLASGTTAAINETFTNVGSDAWTGWHEQVLSTTTVGMDSNYPGFLFRDGSLNVYRNGGLLTEGSDYVLTTQVIGGQLSPNGDWEAMTILFSSGAMIQPGDDLRLTKDIFEVFGDGNTWQLNEAALLAQYPLVPEPASISLAIVGVGVALSRRLWRRRR
jgi:hypothetical protein